MIQSLLLSCAFTVVCGHLLFPVAIRLAHRFDLIDIPTSRRRHPKPMPIVGGVVVFITLVAGLAFFSLLEPWWFQAHGKSLAAVGTAMSLLVVLGLRDDLHGVSPKGKLFWQFAAAALVLVCEPRIHALCLYWSDKIGVVIWFLAATWIVGLSNAVNLIDGLDGLAGGTVLLVSAAMGILGFSWESHLAFGSIVMFLLGPALIPFLMKNWNPAKVFLGDNGSLPLGFLIGCVSLTCPPAKNTWVLLTSIVIMMGYPILDMGLCVIRRYRKKNPLFKADRNHLHYRVLRMGLSVRQTTMLLLGLTLCLQLTALCVSFMSTPLALLAIAMVTCSFCVFLYFLGAVERWTISRMYSAQNAQDPSDSHVEECTVATIELDTLFEVGMFEEKDRLSQVISALELLLRSQVRRDDYVYRNGSSLMVIFSSAARTDQVDGELLKKIKSRLEEFQSLYQLQYSLSALPIKMQRQKFMRMASNPVIIAEAA